MGGMTTSYTVPIDPVMAAKKHDEVDQYMKKTMAQENISINFTFEPKGTSFTLEQMFDNRKASPEMRTRMACEIEKMVESYSIKDEEGLHILAKKDDKYFLRKATDEEVRENNQKISYDERISNMNIIEFKVHHMWRMLQNYWRAGAKIRKKYQENGAKYQK
ncbi:MAG TPA: hypothetical protein VEC16_00690 [Alphaproteobacteria bacterium]|nr:hypothetical protein [Alphaproteobacteria bacterium]